MHRVKYTKKLILLLVLLISPLAHPPMVQGQNADVVSQEDHQWTNRPDVLPVPDPTRLTTEALMREVASLKELFETRLGAMDKAIQLLQARADRSLSIDVVSGKVSHLEDLTDEKFSGIYKQFVERDVRTDQTSRDSKVAVDAALQAAKEAVSEQNKSNALSMDKSEAAFTKQIDQLGLLIATTSKGTDDKIDDIKNRLTLIEGRSQTVETGAGYVLTSAGIGLSAGVLIVGMLGLYLRKQGV